MTPVIIIMMITKSTIITMLMMMTTMMKVMEVMMKKVMSKNNNLINFHQHKTHALKRRQTNNPTHAQHDTNNTITQRKNPTKRAPRQTKTHRNLQTKDLGLITPQMSCPLSSYPRFPPSLIPSPLLPFMRLSSLLLDYFFYPPFSCLFPFLLMR